MLKPSDIRKIYPSNVPVWQQMQCSYLDAGHSIHFQVEGDNPKVEGHNFFQPSPVSGKFTLSQ